MTTLPGYAQSASGLLPLLLENPMSNFLLKLKPFAFALLGFFAAVGMLSMTRIGPALAQSPGVNLAQLLARLTADEAKIAVLQGTPVPGPQGATGPAGAAGSAGATGSIGATGPAGAGFTDDKIALLKTMSLSKDPFVAGTSNLLTISGVNVRIVDGTGSTKSTSGLGNLTVGYNVVGNNNGDIRTGSHNLIVGDNNNYSSYGGLIAGSGNTISGQYASVSGGEVNTASGYISSVSGGAFNTANNYDSSVSGGYKNTASGYNSSVSGGFTNTASGEISSVSGGAFNTASNTAASVSGGDSITLSNAYGWAGGAYHTP